MDPNDPSGGTRPGWVPPPDPAGAPHIAPTPGAPQWPTQPGSWPAQQGAWGPPQGSWAPQGTRKRFGWGAVIGAFLIGGVIAAIVTFGGLIVLALAIGTPDAIAATHPAVQEGTPTAIVGDCLQGRPRTAAVVDRSQVVNCDQAHNSEVTAVIEVPGFRNRPPKDELKKYTDEACSLAFRGYVGSDPKRSQFGYAAIVPDREAWAEDRTVWCMVDTVGQPAGGGTVRNSHR